MTIKMLLIIFIIICVIAIVSMAIRLTKLNYKNIGTIVFEDSVEDGPYLFLELNEDVTKLKNEEIAIVKIEERNYISQK